MEPFSMMAMGAIGFGMQAYGMLGKQRAGGEYNAAQVREIQLQQQVEEQKRKAMELDARRKGIENLRNAQRARSVALANAAGSNAQFGSGLQGGYAQIAGMAGWNAQDISQKLQIGRSTFDLNKQIGEARIGQANARRSMEDYQGWSSLGGSLMSMAPGFGKLASGWGGGGGDYNRPRVGPFR